MRFIDNDGVVLHQQAILLDLRQQNTVGHQLDLIADTAARLRLQLLGDTVGHGSRGQTARLGMAD